VLAYRVQAAFYRGSNGTGGDRGLMSMRDNGGTLEKITPQFSPQIAFNDLFTGFIPPDPAEAAQAQFLLERRKSVIDLVRGDADRLIKRLGAADKIRMQRHFDELRTLENKLAAVQLPTGPECQMLTDPGADPPIGGAVDNGDTGGYAGNGAWSDEETVSALMFTYAQCFLNMNPVFGHPSDVHEIGHYSLGGGAAGQDGMADGVAWHVSHMARLMSKLRDTTDVDGNTILDNTGLVMLFEGGWGFDPEQNNQGSAHSSENMGVLVGGRVGGLNASGGLHIDGGGAHPAQAVNSVLGALGVPGQLGEVSGTIPGLVG
jgi:hypothetical protein